MPTTWDEVLNSAEKEPECSELQRKRVRQAVTYLRKHFDDGSGSIGSTHVLHDHLINRAPWVFEWIIWLAEAMRRTETCKGFSNIIPRLQDPKKLAEGLQVLACAEKLVEANLSVEFDPAISTGKVPDLGITNAAASDQLYIEVSKLERSKEERAVWSKFERINSILFDALRKDSVVYAGRLHRWPAEEHLKDILTSLAAKIDRAKLDGTLVELIEPDVISLAVAPSSEDTALNLWCDKHQVTPNGVSGPGIGVDEFSRLKLKLQTKAAQIPSGFPNVLVIEAPNLLFSAKDRAALVARVEEIIFDIPHLAMLVLSARNFGSGETASQAFGMHRYTSFRETNASWVQAFVLFNRYCRLKIAPETLTKISTALAPPVTAS